MVDLPGDDMFKLSAMTLMKRGDGCCTDRTIKAVQFQFSVDGGENWEDYMDGKWVKTGALPSDGRDMQRKFTIDPPMYGNAFRVIIDKKHIHGHEI